jgi:hypothetical protein
VRKILRELLKFTIIGHTGTSITLTSPLVQRSPITRSQASKAKNKATKRATEAGKEIELRPIRELTPKHVNNIIKIPTGT